MKLSKLLLVLILVLSLFIIHYSLFIKRARAQVPPPKVQCGTQSDPEFHSLRPYQASPCGDSDKALFCGNNIIITETASGSTTDCNATELEVNKVINKTYVIDLKETELPILGNTENVKNSQGGTDEFDDATKVNEYVSWYLSGVNNRAEYGENTDDKVINLSGPIQKLLPSAIQDAQRILTIESVKKTTVFSDQESDQEAKQISEPENHNQIVVCESGGKPVECPGGEKRRLLDWDNGDLSFFNTFFNWLGTDQWNKKYPPLPWQFKEEVLYQKAYQEWRGNTCAILFGKLVCTENLFVPNKWANLFQYVPLANTVDKNAKVIVVGEKAQIQPMGDTTLSPIYRNELLEEPALFFAHTREDKDLSESLNKTYVPKEGTDSSVNPEISEINEGTTLGQCRVVDVRSNEGDNLFAEVDPNQYRNAVDFTIVTVPCQSECTPHEDKYGNIWYSKKCQGGATITLKTQTKTPFAEDIWKNTVAGGESTFQKIFPKVGEGAPVSCIADLPTVTTAVYEPTQDVSEIKVVGPQGSGDGSDAQLFFPHIGSVYEYFLKGIQTALRPQGYGEPITDGQYCKPKEETKCKEDVPDSAVPSKYLGAFKSNFIDLANRWSLKCPGAENNMAEKCYNFVASVAQKEGVNPAFALTIWLNESGASNYCDGGETTQDFGINLPELYQDLAGQLLRFIGMAKTKLCDGVSGFSEPMHGWMSRFQSSAGICDPNDSVATQYYMDVRETTWNWVTSCTKNGKFGIQWPTDMSCP